MTGALLSCPEHGPTAEPDHRFCEVCGRDLHTGELPATRRPAAAAPDTGPPRPPWVSSRSASEACAGCGTVGTAAGGYCDHCGRRRSVGRDRAELDLGVLAGVTDRARRRHNEDAVALGGVGGATAAVVCDGVSSSTRADAASHAAAEAGIVTLLAALGAGTAPRDATVQAARKAAAAARAAARPGDGNTPPSCTYVSAVVTEAGVTVGWIGDSRAYWLSPVPGGSGRLSIDDSVAGQLAAGRAVPPGAAADPNSRALIRWLGADSDDSEPQVVSVRPDTPGLVLLCSDGLSHYLSEPDDLAAAAAVSPPTGGAAAVPATAVPAPPIGVARTLTRLALDAGGHDNVAVAVLPFPPLTNSAEGSVP